MLNKNNFPVTILLAIIILFYSWTFFFQGNAWLTALGINVLQIAVGLASLLWLFQAYRKAARRQKNFWLLLLIGLALYISANGLWLYFQISRGAVDSEEFSYAIWLVAYFFFLAALISKTRELSNAYSGRSYIFNIAVFMIMLASASFHYLINPVLEASGDSWLLTFATIIYPVTDLTILFVLTILYYLLQKSEKQEWLILCVAGFFIQVMADSYSVYLTFSHGYQPGHVIDLLWLVSILFIGLTGYCAKQNLDDTTWIMKSPGKNKDSVFPYLSIVVLIILAIHSYQWNLNALSAGLLVIFLLVLGRQLQILRRNEQLMSEYRYLAYHDPLTGLKNRSSFGEQIERVLTEYPDGKLALLLIDLDQFKVVNDTLGHHIGDKVLVQAARRLESAVGRDMLLFRLGGDEFIIVVAGATEAECIALSNEILAAFQEVLNIDGYQISVTPSIGISKFPEHGSTTEELMKNADAAMYLSKEKGKNGFSFFNPELSREKIRKMKIETELKTAIRNNQLQIHYQPKVMLSTNGVVGMEALLRWEHPELGWVSPAEFIPVAEETGQIVSIGEWVLQQACRQNKKWQDEGFPPLSVAVNVSVLQFKHGLFLETVRRILGETGLDTRYLELEITESIMQNIKESREILKCLRGMGIKIAIDDFGTGYSSLHVLQKLPIDTIKIDKSFVDELDSNSMNPMVKTIIDLGLNLNLTIVAEGIESEDQRDILLNQGCTIGQGYLYSKPVTPEAFEELMRMPEVLDAGKLAAGVQSGR